MRQGFVRRLWDYCHHNLIHEWPSALFVSAAVSILLHQTSWLDAVDGYAWLVTGNLSTVGQSAPQSPRRAVVVLIDEKANRDAYHDRSPLDRCRLRDDLNLLYSGQPSVLAIDLDISPALWLSRQEDGSARQSRCQQQIYELIRTRSCGGIRTVLMKPFESPDGGAPPHQSAIREMQQQIDGAAMCRQPQAAVERVRVGDAVLPVEYGLLLRHYDGPAYFSSLVYRAYQESGPASWFPKDKADERKRIDPRWATNGGVVVKGIGEVQEDLSKLKGMVVFFGAAFGEQDTYLTPLGSIYGVEAHALAFMSMLDPIGHFNGLWEFAGEVLLALLFGLLISRMWEQYFQGRVGADPVQRQLAPLLVTLLFALLLCVILLVSWLSLVVLRNWGIWLSPVPIALGMLADGFMVGSVNRARHELLRLENVPVVEPESLWESIQRFAWRDTSRLWTSTAASTAVADPVRRLFRNRAAAIMIGFRRLAWASVVALALVQASTAKDDCVGLKSLQDQLVGKNDTKGTTSERYAPCGSLRSVLDKLANWNKTGGRKLEADKPFDPAAAQANLDRAMRDVGIRTRLEQLKREVWATKERMVYEAAILDDEGYYDARDLRIHQLHELLH